MNRMITILLLCVAWGSPAFADAIISQGKLDKAIFTAYTSIKRVPITRTINGQPLSSNVTVTTISGNAATATALAANGTNCSAGQAALGVDASGNSEGCWTPAGVYTLPAATSSVLGGVKPDGTTILNTAGAISVANPLNQNTTGTSAGLSGTPALPNGTTATTQTSGNNSTKLATTAYVDTATASLIKSKLVTVAGTTTNVLQLDFPNASYAGVAVRLLLTESANSTAGELVFNLKGAASVSPTVLTSGSLGANLVGSTGWTHTTGKSVLALVGTDASTKIQALIEIVSAPYGSDSAPTITWL